MTDLTGKEIRYVLPEIRVQHPKTGEPLCIVTPAAGSVFDVRIPEGITESELLVVVSDLAQFCYQSTMAAQKKLIGMGWTPEQLGEVFFPDAEKSDLGAPEVLHQKLADATRVALATSDKWQKMLAEVPISKFNEAGTIDFANWERTDYEQTLAWLMDERDEIPKCIFDYMQLLESAGN